MEYDNEISSSKDKFDFSWLLNDEITSFHKYNKLTIEKTDENGDEIRDIKRYKKEV